VSKPFKIGFIGAGGIARHQMGLIKKIEGAEVVAAADIHEPTLARAREMYQIPSLYTDYHEMLREENDIEAVSVCTPNGLHAENTIAALEAGKHVMVEKPMAMNAREAQKMIDAAKRSGKELVIGFQYRFGASSELLRQQVVAGELGNILYVRCQAMRRRGIPNWGVFGRRDLQGGGPMIDIGVHIIECAHYIMGSPRPVAATGNTWTYHGNKPSDVRSQWPNWDYTTYDVEDLAVGMIRIEKDVFNMQILGEKGGAVWDPPQIYKDHAGYMMNSNPGFLPQIDHFLMKMKHFVEVCQGKRANEAPGEHGLMVQKILDGVYASAAAGHEVNIE
jgi:predicted dehydrogenase